MRTPNYSRYAAQGIISSMLILIGSLMTSQAVRAAELIQNGTFDGGMTGWKVAPKLNGWDPCSSSTTPSLSPTIFGYSGVLFYQDLNVANVSLRSLDLTVGIKKLYASEVSSFAVYLDYATSSLQIKRIMALCPANASLPDSIYTNINISVAIPGDATKLVRLLIGVLDGNNGFNLNEVSLTAAGLVPGPLPTIGSVSPSRGGYYSATESGLITIRGSNLGTTGQVFLAESPMEIVPASSAPWPSAQIVSWNPTQVVARVVEPMSSGKVYLLSGGVESQGDFYFTISSPSFSLTAVEAERTVLRGQTLTALFRLDLLNGFHTDGGVSCMVVAPVFGPPPSTPLFDSGGFSFELDTSALTNGDYVGMAQSLEGSSYARWAPFALKVRSITNIAFTVGYPPTSITSLAVPNQGEFTYDFNYNLIDNTGASFGTGGATPPVTIVSDNPAAVMVINGGFGPRLFAVGEGTAHLLFSTPNGYSRTLSVTVTLPISPRFTSASVFPYISDNSGLSTNTIVWQATEDLTWVGYEGMVPFPLDKIERDWVNHGATWTFGVPEGAAPGTYLFDAQLGDSLTKSFVALTVTNAPSKGQIAGSIFTVASTGFFMHETMGNLEFYDATTGVIVRTNQVQNYNSDSYLASYLTPGAYRLRWVPMFSAMSPQWYPQAASFAQAATIQVLAGTTVSNINFYQRPKIVPPSEFNLPAPRNNGSELSFPMLTTYGVTYILEYKDGLGDAPWLPAQSLFGNGSRLAISDPAPSPVRRFYRLRMQAP